MTLTAESLKGLRKIVPAGKTVWVYGEGSGQQYYPQDNASEPFPSWGGLPLAGALDLVTGKVMESQDEAPAVGPGRSAPDWFVLMEYAFKAFIGLCAVSALLIFTIFAGHAGTSRR